MRKNRKTLGYRGESLAAEYLEGINYEIIARNVHTSYGEIDLVARQRTPTGNVIVFVEVKTRQSTAFGLPEEGVTKEKQAHLLAAAQAILQDRPELDGDWRVDVIAIQISKQGRIADLTHFENAIH